MIECNEKIKHTNLLLIKLSICCWNIFICWFSLWMQIHLIKKSQISKNPENKLKLNAQTILSVSLCGSCRNGSFMGCFLLFFLYPKWFKKEHREIPLGAFIVTQTTSQQYDAVLSEVKNKNEIHLASDGVFLCCDDVIFRGKLKSSVHTNTKLIKKREEFWIRRKRMSKTIS